MTGGCGLVLLVPGVQAGHVFLGYLVGSIDSQITGKSLEFLRDGLPKKKLQLVGTSIPLILLSPEPGCYTHGPIPHPLQEQSSSCSSHGT